MKRLLAPPPPSAADCPRFASGAAGRAVRLGLLTVLALSGCSRDLPPLPDAPEVPEGHWAASVADVGLESPAAVIYDEQADLYLVSNVAGPPLARDGRGFISRLSPDGHVRALRWIDGGQGGATLDAPKGMALAGDVLYVADLGCVRRFQRDTGVSLDPICPSGAVALNDVTVDEDGTVYATDGGLRNDATGGAIWAIGPDGVVAEALQGGALADPRGIASSPRGVFFASYEGGSVSQVTPDGPRRVLGNRGWNLEGLVFAAEGSFAFSNPADSTVLFVRAKDKGAKGEVFTLIRGIPAPGDPGYDSRRERILVPERDRNRLFFVDLLPSGGSDGEP